MSGAPVRIFNRYTDQFEEEAIYGEGFIRFAYETALGRAFTGLIGSRPLISKIVGWHMRRPSSKGKIIPFIKRYGLNADEFAQPVESFRDFNDFFRRELKQEARPVAEDPDAVVFPADGRHLGWPKIGSEERVFVKGQHWDLDGLLGNDPALIKTFAGGTLVLSRLCPVDYHRFHFPASGRLVESRWLGKRLFSVNPISLRMRLSFLWENRRCLNLLQTPNLGQICFIEIGATNVGSIRHESLPPDAFFKKGQMKGWFEFGGSSLITLFEPERIELSPDLVSKSGEGIELYARVGDRMGTICQAG